jgi:hypothetical protein
MYSNKEMVQERGERREEGGGRRGRREERWKEGGRRFTSTNIKRGECSGPTLPVIPQIIHYVTIARSGDVLK